MSGSQCEDTLETELMDITPSRLCNDDALPCSFRNLRGELAADHCCKCKVECCLQCEVNYYAGWVAEGDLPSNCLPKPSSAPTFTGKPTSTPKPSFYFGPPTFPPITIPTAPPMGLGFEDGELELVLGIGLGSAVAFCVVLTIVLFLWAANNRRHETSDMKRTVEDELRANEHMLAAPRPSVIQENSDEFLAQLHRYLYCRDAMDQKYHQVDEYHRIARLQLVADSGGIANKAGNSDEYKAEYLQQAITGKPVNDLDELYVAAEMAQPIFKEALLRIVRVVCGEQNHDDVAHVVIAPLKCKDRAAEKAGDDYFFRKPGPPEGWLYDIVRGSIEFSECDLLAECLELIQSDPNIHIVKAKNRFETPTLSGYRDCNLCIRLDCHVDIRLDCYVERKTFSHICEVQIHHKGIRKLDKELNTHECYEYFRSYFLGSTEGLKERLHELRRISHGEVLNAERLNNALGSEDAEWIECLAALMGEKIGELVWSRLLYARLTVLYHKQNDLAKMAVAFRKQGKHEASEACSFLEKPPRIGEHNVVHPSRRNEELHLLEDLRSRDPLVDTGLHLLDQLQFWEAKMVFKSAAGAYIEDGGFMDESVAALFSQIGKLENNTACSIEWHSKALDIQRRSLGVNHPSVNQSVNQIASLKLLYAKRVAYAQNACRLGIAIIQKNPDQPDAGLETIRRSLEMMKNSVGEDAVFQQFRSEAIASVEEAGILNHSLWDVKFDHTLKNPRTAIKIIHR